MKISQPYLKFACSIQINGFILKKFNFVRYKLLARSNYIRASKSLCSARFSTLLETKNEMGHLGHSVDEHEN